MTSERYIDLPGRMTEMPRALRQPEPMFDFDLSTADDYGAILQAGGSVGYSEDDLWADTPRVGRVLLLGDGGSGKTSILGRLWNRAKENGGFACWIDLRRWNATVAEEWEAIEEDSWSAELLLRQLGTPATFEQELELAAPKVPMLLLIDGINEVPNELAERLIQTADYLARRHPQLGVIVADRLVRRESVTARWKLVRVVAARAGQKRPEPLLQNAFFLNLSIREEIDGTAAGDALHDYFVTHVGLGDEQLAITAEAAAYAYRDGAARAFELESFAGRVGEEVLAKLEQAGQLIRRPPICYFAHQLVHDTLAADWLAGDKARWGAEWFDALTFKASSFDALALALERLDEPALVDTFLRRVYDWNYYGAAFALARAQEFGDVRVSDTMRLALLAMLAERQWDPMVATVDRVQDALRLIGDDVAQAMLDAESFQEVRNFVAGQSDGDAAFDAWRDLFLRDPEDAADRELIEALRDEDSLTGWTAANVMRRCPPTEDALRDVIGLARYEHDDVVRWRAVHVLGAWPTSDSAKTIQHCLLDDTDRWVRYGATRSLIDLAAESEPLREEILPWLTGHLSDLPQPTDQIITELERSLVRNPMPDGWIDSVTDLVSELFAQSSDDRERDRWRHLASRLRRAAGQEQETVGG
ncbi:MAG TPA: HEAT repeat domain-containing protein [Solirubrobacterales bacterium]|nr:HEAT repeat domain-containing protein [Solirubrobacterales bacterium]